MDILPILSTLRRHKTAATLIVLEIALTCAIVCNAIFLIGSRLERMDTPTGLAESELLVLRMSSTQRLPNPDAITQQDLAALRALPGVRNAVSANQVVFGNNSSDVDINLKPDQAASTLQASFYVMGPGAIDTLGLRLREGRDFQPEEFRPQSLVESDPQIQMPVVIVDAATAARLFPGASAVGKTVYMFSNAPSRIIGVVDHLVPPRPGQPEGDYGVLMPVWPAYNRGNYIVRTQSAADRAAVMKAAVQVLQQADARRIVTQQDWLSDMRREFYEQDRWMATLLVAVCLALLVVTAFGIVGLASFWVQQRRRMIGVRRALGASRRQVLGYFQTENLLLTSIGIVLGMLGAYAINAVLMTQYELPRLPGLYLPFGALLLLALGQVAVLGPALRAAALPPVVVMRGA